MECKHCKDNEEKLEQISIVVNGALLTTNMKLNGCPEVYISGERYIPVNGLEEVLEYIQKIIS